MHILSDVGTENTYTVRSERPLLFDGARSLRMGLREAARPPETPSQGPQLAFRSNFAMGTSYPVDLEI